MTTSPSLNQSSFSLKVKYNNEDELLLLTYKGEEPGYHFTKHLFVSFLCVVH